MDDDADDALNLIDVHADFGELKRVMREKAAIDKLSRDSKYFFVFFFLFLFYLFEAGGVNQRFRVTEQMENLLVRRTFKTSDAFKAQQGGAAGTMTSTGAAHGSSEHSTAEATAGSHATFFQIENKDDVWSYVEQVLMPRVLEPAAAHNKSFGNQMNLLWGIRIRQQRVDQFTDCDQPPKFTDIAKELQPESPDSHYQVNCYPRYSAATRGTSNASFGPIQSNKLPLYAYTQEAETKDASFSGRLGMYPGDGFIQFLPVDNITLARQRITEMQGWDPVAGKEATFLDSFTRALFITFSAYNTNSKNYVYVQLSLEFGIAGEIFRKRDAEREREREREAVVRGEARGRERWMQGLRYS